jgi:hypothetical protein
MCDVSATRSPVNPNRPSNRPIKPQRPKPVARPRLVLVPADGLPGIFIVRDEKGTSDYGLEPIGSAWGSAFKITKLAFEGPEAEYHVLIDLAEGCHSCECKGQLAWGHRHPCRHITALLQFIAAGQLSATTVEPTVSEYPEYIGDEAVDHFEEPMPF